MANWANVNYVIEGDAQDIAKIGNVIDSINKSIMPPFKNSDKNWEGNIILALGGEVNVMGGFITEYTINENTIHISAEEAWSLTDFGKLLTELFPNVKVYYRIIECGSGIFETNDFDGKYFPEIYYLDSYINGQCYCAYFNSMDDAIDYLREFGIISEEEITRYNETAMPNCIYIHDIVFVD